MVNEQRNAHQRGGNLASTRRPAVRKVRTKQLNSYLGVRAQRIHLLTLRRSFLSAGAGRQHACQHPTQCARYSSLGPRGLRTHHRNGSRVSIRHVHRAHTSAGLIGISCVHRGWSLHKVQDTDDTPQSSRLET